MENKSQIRICVACLAAYNNGYLHGRWIDANQDAWAIYDEIADMLRASPMPNAEEWAIHDHEGFEGVRIEKYAGIDSVAEMAAFIAHFGETEDARNALNDHYHGEYFDLADYMQSVTEECIAIPDHLRLYIDWRAMARDAELSGDLFTIKTRYDEIHVFAGC